MEASGRRLAKARLPEGVAGIRRLHAMIAEQLGEQADEAEMIVGIEARGWQRWSRPGTRCWQSTRCRPRGLRNIGTKSSAKPHRPRSAPCGGLPASSRHGRESRT
jgi:hypothetical protein